METSRQVLVDWLERALVKMQGDNASAGPLMSDSVMTALRELQVCFNPLMLENSDSRTRLVAFFLNAYVDSVFMDLLGDTPDDTDGVLQAVREKLFMNIVENLDYLLECLKNGDNVLDVLERFVASYTDSVGELNYKDIQLGGGR
ncbi:MAG: hypothetical protein JW883_00370 [Deltaproteobacteria bacterium]|nr:hypothetical protein [Deltaproteobacteria bacterium]